MRQDWTGMVGAGQPHATAQRDRATALCETEADGDSQALPLGVALEVGEQAAFLDPALPRPLPLL